VIITRRYGFLSILIILSILLLANCSKSSTGSKNNVPVISSITITPSTVPASGLVTVTVTATDQDGGHLLYSFSADEGTITGDGLSRIWSAPSTVGTYTISITVSDLDGAETTESANLTVTAPVTQITGMAQFKAGVSGDLSNTPGYLYASIEDAENLNPYKTFNLAKAGNIASFIITDIDPGTYYLEIFKDNNNNQTINNGDYYGIYGTVEAFGTVNPMAINISEDQTFMCDITVYIIPDI